MVCYPMMGLISVMMSIMVLMMRIMAVMRMVIEAVKIVEDKEPRKEESGAPERITDP